MKKLVLLAASVLLLAGCFETDFKFKTTVRPDGSLTRETEINGRGADLFIPPSGKGWEVKTYETRGGESILEDTYHHIQAKGRFRSSSQIGSDYQYDASKAFKDISDEERKNFIKLGIVEPFEENIYSKNFVHITKQRGLFKSTIQYQETFQNKAIIQLLLNDVKKEVIREQIPLAATSKVPPTANSFMNEPKKTPEAPANTEAPVAEETKEPAQTEETNAPKEPVEEEELEESVTPVTVEGQLLSSRVIETVALEKMKNEMLSKFKFRSEVTMPGKIVSTNADTVNGKTAMWQFEMSDFAPNFSNYTLQVRSEIVEWKALVLMIFIVLAFVIGIFYARSGRWRPKREFPRRKKTA